MTTKIRPLFVPPYSLSHTYNVREAILDLPMGDIPNLLRFYEVVTSYNAHKNTDRANPRLVYHNMSMVAHIHLLAEGPLSQVALEPHMYWAVTVAPIFAPPPCEQAAP